MANGVENNVSNWKLLYV